jgi:hypothetical protein
MLNTTLEESRNRNETKIAIILQIQIFKKKSPNRPNNRTITVI